MILDSNGLVELRDLTAGDDGSYMINNFIRKTSAYWRKIKNRDLEYFRVNNNDTSTKT